MRVQPSHPVWSRWYVYQIHLTALFFNASTGVEIFSNSSGSHHELRKLDTRVNLITQATKLVSLSITLEASFLTLL